MIEKSLGEYIALSRRLASKKLRTDLSPSLSIAETSSSFFSQVTKPLRKSLIDLPLPLASKVKLTPFFPTHSNSLCVPPSHVRLDRRLTAFAPSFFAEPSLLPTSPSTLDARTRCSKRSSPSAERRNRQVFLAPRPPSRTTFWLIFRPSSPPSDLRELRAAQIHARLVSCADESFSNARFFATDASLPLLDRLSYNESIRLFPPVNIIPKIAVLGGWLRHYHHHEGVLKDVSLSSLGLFSFPFSRGF